MKSKNDIHYKLASKAEKAEEEELDDILKKIKKDDAEQAKEGDADKTQDVTKAKSVKMQKKIFDQLLHQRILLQKPMTYSQRFPQNEAYLELLKQKDVEIAEKLTENKRQLKKHIKDLRFAQKSLFEISNTNVKVKKVDTDTDNLEDLWTQLDSNFQATVPFLENTINRWNSMTQPALLNQKGKAAKNQGIVLQVNKIIGDPQTMQKAVLKTQYLKQDEQEGVIGPLLNADGELMPDDEKILRERDTGIYNDHDFYQQLLHDFLNGTGQEGQEEQQQEEAGNQDYLFGADLSLTQKFLAKKQQLKEIQLKKKKEIDRKATKGRKIRYVVHDKMQSFMAPEENLRALEYRDSILQTMFGRKQEQPSSQDQQKVDKKIKKDKKKESKVKLI